VHLLDEATVFEWLPDLDKRVWTGLPRPVVRADYIRTRLVHLHGGIWLDSDLVALRPLREIFAWLDERETVGWGREFNDFKVNLFASRAGSAFLGEWIAGQDALLQKSADCNALRWRELGSDIALPLAQTHRTGWIPSSRIAPVYWPAWRIFLSRFATPERVLADLPITVMLFNAVMGPALRGLSREELLRSHMLVSRLLRIALGISTLDHELDSYTRFHVLADVRHGSFPRLAWKVLSRTRGITSARRKS
jgi:hypothetical protein